MAQTKITPIEIYNPYKFSAYRSIALVSSATDTTIPFDTELFDTNSNFDVTTNVGRYTAPVAGFYQFSGSAGNTLATSTLMRVSVKVNGSIVKIGTQGTWTGNANLCHLSTLVQLNAGDYVELTFVGGAGSTMYVGINQCWFTGFLVSQT